MTYSDAYRIGLMAAAAALAPHRPGSPIQDLLANIHNGVELALSPAPVEPARPEAAVSARASVKADAVTCMSCGFVGKSLKRHLRTSHDLTPEAYREYWGLHEDHPIVAPTYSTRRSDLAKLNGLGRIK